MGNGPIRRRPWRKPPWRSKKRPTRWGAQTNEILGNSTIDPIPIPTMAGTARAPVFELLTGSVDVEPWADDQEVTIDRIVGDIAFRTGIELDAGDLVFQQAWQPVVRMGLVVVEEAGAPSLDLFDDQTLTSIEWIWLHQGFTELGYGFGITGGATRIVEQGHVAVDIRNRRKLGQADTLYLYAGLADLTGDASERATLTGAIVPMLRMLMMSR